jgi:hypothetical protein
MQDIPVIPMPDTKGRDIGNPMVAYIENEPF